MKKILILLIGILLSTYSFPEHVDVKIASQVALNFMKQQKNNKTFTIKDVIAEMSDSINVICYYTVTFNEGGWIMVSADNSVNPILGFSYNGIIDVTKQNSDVFVGWTNIYKKQIIAVNNSKTNSPEVKTRWDDLINNQTSSEKLTSSHKSSLTTYSSCYTPGSWLLNTPDRGEVHWNQEKNNSGTCTPCYNEYCEDKSVYNPLCTFSTATLCYCQNKPLGCGAIAMGHIMWYWKWPNYTANSTYNWDIMPNMLYDYSTGITQPAQANAVAGVLNDIADEAEMTFCCAGSYTSLDNISDAFKFFKYNSVEEITRDKDEENYWVGDPAWTKFIKAEIDACRPVLYRGGDFVTWSTLEYHKKWGDIHYFVCDGYEYDGSGNLYFHFNFGGADPEGFFTIDNLTPDGDNYNGNQMAIIGISGTCGNIPTFIDDVPYTSVSNNEALYAYDYISLPHAGKTLTVNSGANYSLGAGESIKLNSGFKAESGSIFKASIYNLNCSNDCGMAVEAWPTLFDFNYGTSDPCSYLDINVANANTFELRVWNSIGQIVYLNAGYISSSPVCVWNSCNTPSLSVGYYQCNVIFRDNCGEEISHTWEVCYPCNPPPPQSKVSNDSTLVTTGIKNINPINNIEKLNIYPNPNNGNMQVIYEIPKNIIGTFNIYDLMGKQILNYPLSGGKNTLTISATDIDAGVYFYRATVGNKIIAKDKIVVIK